MNKLNLAALSSVTAVMDSESHRKELRVDRFLNLWRGSDHTAVLQLFTNASFHWVFNKDLHNVVYYS